MRVAFIGTHGTGKSTATNFIVGKRQLLRLYRYPEYAREILDCITMYDPDFDWMKCIKTNPMIYTMFEVSIVDLYEVQAVSDNYVADRTPLDIMAYIQNFVNVVFPKSENKERPDIIDVLLKKAWAKCNSILESTTYDLVFFLRAIDGDKTRMFIDKYIEDNLDKLKYYKLVELQEKPDLNKVLEIFDREADQYYSRSASQLRKQITL